MQSRMMIHKNYNPSETTKEIRDKVKSALLVNIIVRKSETFLKLLASEDETLLVDPDTLLDLRLHIVDGVRGLDLEGDRFPIEALTKICIPPRRRRTRWRVDSFWML